VPVIISGGRVMPHGEAEAPVVRRFLQDLGVAANQIIVEQNSRDTHENALLTELICRRHGFTAPILVTSAYHLKRAVLSYEQVGLAVTPFPAGFYTRRQQAYHWDDFLPDSRHFEKTAAALREHLGTLFYKLAY
jgi:uncharacterized SAM-binding protein YcdF (DUF218 family)